MITFRETLEAALIIGIILAFLAKTKNKKYNKLVYWGTAAGILGSILAAIIFVILAGGFEGQAEEIFEGITMLIGSFLLSTMILWMMNQKHIAQELKEKVEYDIKHKDKFGLFFLVFVSILREGVETVIFLGAASYLSTSNRIIGGALGIITASILGYMIFVASMKVNLKKFFNMSSVLLLLFAAGLTAHGIHELQEAHVIPIYKEHVWDINPPAPQAEEGIYPPLHENGVIGNIAKGLFGYNGNPSLLEIISYVVYVFVIFALYLNIEKKRVNEKKIRKNLN